MRTYKFIEHTADIAIRVKAPNLRALFENAAAAMFDIMARKRKTSPANRSKTIKVRQRGEGLEELLVNWLNELLYLSVSKGLVFNKFNIEQIDEKKIVAEVSGEKLSSYELRTEIKAATYHRLKIKRLGSGWTLEVVFDA